MQTSRTDPHNSKIVQFVRPNIFTKLTRKSTIYTVHLVSHKLHKVMLQTGISHCQFERVILMEIYSRKWN